MKINELKWDNFCKKKGDKNMKRYNPETMKGVTEQHQRFIDEAIEKGWDLYLEKGIKGWDEDGNEINISARIVNEEGLFIANVTTNLPEEDEFINYRL